MDITEFFNSIDLNKINEFIDNRREEDLHLDFKRLNDSEMTKDDRKTFAKALSGYANADGGIIVWGIDAPNSRAYSKIPIPRLQRALAKLNEFTGNLVNPSVDGVIHIPIDCGKDSGFVKTLIPSSDSTPHMAKGGEDRYYKRSGDSFRKLEHFDVEDMFGRRAKPVLSLSYRVDNARTGSGVVFLILGLRNDGKGSAKSPYLSIKPTGCQIYDYGLDGNQNEGLPRLTTARDSQWTSWGGDGDKVIHPGINMDILALKVTLDLAAQPNFASLIVEYKMATDGMSLVEDKLNIDTKSLTQLIKDARED